MFIQTARLRDRTPVTIRSIQPADAELILEMHERSSAATLYQRYLRHIRLSLADCEGLANLPASEGMALVATVDRHGEQIVAVAHYIVAEQVGTAEPALLVEDDYQGRGLGSILFRLLCQQAQKQGIQGFEALIYGSNDQILGVLRRSGFQFEGAFVQGMRDVRIWL